MVVINENKYIDRITLSTNLDKVILNESRILNKNLKNKEAINSNIMVNYV